MPGISIQSRSLLLTLESENKIFISDRMHASETHSILLSSVTLYKVIFSSDFVDSESGYLKSVIIQMKAIEQDLL